MHSGSMAYSLCPAVILMALAVPPSHAMAAPDTYPLTGKVGWGTSFTHPAGYTFGQPSIKSYQDLLDHRGDPLSTQIPLGQLGRASTDPLWADEFALPSVDGTIWCAARFEGGLVVGGSFRQIGGVSVNNIASWDGTAWHSLGEGVDRGVRCLTEYKGHLYAAGWLECSSIQGSAPLSVWDGADWTQIDNPFDDTNCSYEILSLVVFRDELIVGGGVRSYFPSSQSSVTRWDGSTWGILGDGLNGQVEAMLVAGDSLYVGGAFDSAGGLPISNVAMWDGASWSALGSGVNRRALTLAHFQGDVIAGGEFDSAGSVQVPALAAWDGTQWLRLGDFDPSDWRVTALAVHDQFLAIGNYPTIGVWDGTSWNPDVGGISGFAQLTSDVDGLIAFGWLEILDESGRPRGFSIARWNDGSWYSYEPWNGNMKGLTRGSVAAQVSCLASFQGDVVAGGYITHAGAGSSWMRASPVCSWSGSQWHAMPFPQAIFFAIPNGFLAEADTLYATGWFQSSVQPPDTLNPYGKVYQALRWTSNEWTPMASVGVATGTCLARYGGALMLGTSAGVYVWDGIGWRAIGTIAGHDPYLDVRSLLVHEGRLIAGGAFTSIGGTAARGVAAWDGFTWQALGDGPPGYTDPYAMYLTGMTVHDGKLIAAGQFLVPGGTVPLCEWDGTTWSAVEGITGHATAVYSTRGKVFVGGNMRIGPERVEATVAVWDGVSWSPLGSGVNDYVSAFLEHRSSLYLAGSFSSAGGKSSFGIARWDGFPSPLPRSVSVSQARPNPFLASTDLSFELDRPHSTRVAIYDVSGREVALLQDGEPDAGSYVVRWNGTDHRLRKVPAGVYFISLSLEGRTIATRKVVLLR